jgi:hypothetical protein
MLQIWLKRRNKFWPSLNGLLNNKFSTWAAASSTICSRGRPKFRRRCAGTVRKKAQARKPPASPILPGFGAGGSGQLQHRGTLAHTQAREQHHMPVREFQRVVMGHGVVHVDLPEAREPLSDFLVFRAPAAAGRAPTSCAGAGLPSPGAVRCTPQSRLGQSQVIHTNNVRSRSDSPAPLRRLKIAEASGSGTCRSRKSHPRGFARIETSVKLRIPH